VLAQGVNVLWLKCPRVHLRGMSDNHREPTTHEWSLARESLPQLTFPRESLSWYKDRAEITIDLNLAGSTTTCTLLLDSPTPKSIASWVNYSRQWTESSSEHYVNDPNLLEADTIWCENKRYSDSNPGRSYGSESECATHYTTATLRIVCICHSAPRRYDYTRARTSISDYIFVYVSLCPPNSTLAIH